MRPLSITTADSIGSQRDSPARSFAQVGASDLAAIKGDCAAGKFAEANRLAVSSAQYHRGGEGKRHPGYEMLISIPPVDA